MTTKITYFVQLKGAKSVSFITSTKLTVSGRRHELRSTQTSPKHFKGRIYL